ncbi:hypothetical protein C6Q22_26895 [Burkholderia multivorans]|nr:hypothetical protein C6Q22_26895 [Burkholderia multivorans]PRG61937.1 hypothetical protein C6T69_26195 [Burkholderia multivorans]
MRTTRSTRSISKACSTAATSATAHSAARAHDAGAGAPPRGASCRLPRFARMRGRSLFYGPRRARGRSVQT